LPPEYQPLPSVIATEAALSADAPKLWAECPDNECFFFTLGDKGTVEAAFARAHHITPAGVAPSYYNLDCALQVLPHNSDWRQILAPDIRQDKILQTV
jgi:hypothetical protein